MNGMENTLLSTDSILKPLCDKVDLIKTNIEFLKCLNCNRSESLSIIKEIEERKYAMQNDTKKLRELLKEQKKVYEEEQALNSEVSHLSYKLDQLDKLAASKQMIADEHSCVTNGNGCVKEPELLHSAFKGEERNSYDEFSPVPLNVAPPRLRRDLNLKPKCIAFDILYLTEEEYKMLPKYMVGRLTLEAINKFVDAVNEAVSKKYNILAKPVSALKSPELSLYRTFKRQQNAGVKGKHFVTEEDIAREFNKHVLEKKAYNFLTILRHVKRLSMIRLDGCVTYIVNNEKM